MSASILTNNELREAHNRIMEYICRKVGGCGIDDFLTAADIERQNEIEGELRLRGMTKSWSQDCNF